MKPETQNRRLEPTGLAKPGESCGLMGTGPGLARQESAGWVFGQFWIRTNPFLRSKPGPLVGYPDPLLTIARTISACKTLCLYFHHDLVVGIPLSIHRICLLEVLKDSFSEH